MLLEAKKLLWDMAEATKAIQHFVRERTSKDLDTDEMLRSAVYFQFMIIGEALSQLRDVEMPVAERITDS